MPKEVPDVWFNPIYVWEIRAADFTLSPQYKSAENVIESGKGISVRFPRYIRERSDKLISQCTNSEQLADMYRNQKVIENTSKKAKVGEEDDEEEQSYHKKRFLYE